MAAAFNRADQHLIQRRRNQLDRPGRQRIGKNRPPRRRGHFGALKDRTQFIHQSHHAGEYLPVAEPLIGRILGGPLSQRTLHIQRLKQLPDGLRKLPCRNRFPIRQRLLQSPQGRDQFPPQCVHRRFVVPLPFLFGSETPRCFLKPLGALNIECLTVISQGVDLVQRDRHQGRAKKAQHVRRFKTALNRLQGRADQLGQRVGLHPARAIQKVRQPILIER